MEDNKRILNKLDIMDERIDSIDKSLAVYNEQLKVHIEGTVQNRTAIATLRSDLRPVEDHVKAVNTVLKVAGAVGLLLAAFESIKNLFS